MKVEDMSAQNNDPSDMFVDFKIINVEQTPAHKVETFVATSRQVLKKNEFDRMLNKQEGMSILGKDHHSEYRVRLKAKAAEIRDLDENKQRIYVYGLVRCADIYQVGHTTRFCSYIRGTAEESYLLPCNHWNYAG